VKVRTYQDSLNYLESFIGKVIFQVNKEFLKKHDPLERMRVFLNLLGNPQEKFKSVLVGGTSGKGSTSYLISHILTTAGYKTGFTLSPHLQKVNERIQINGKEIPDLEFTEMVASMIRIIEQMKKMKIGEPSYFEILIGMAFKYFADQKVDIAVVEVGMGGEFDATNTLNPLIAVLTNVGLDHTNVLGNTVEKIAKTKAGIIKSSKLTVVTGVKQPSVVKIVEDKCKKVGAELNLLWRDFGYKIKKEDASGIEFDFISHKITLENLNLSLVGSYQVENASLAIKTILELGKFGFSHFAKASRDKKISDEAIKKALKSAFFPGRFEIINYTLDAKRYTLVLDGAHNPTKMKEFLKNLKKIFPTQKKVFIIGFKFDKDIPKMLKQIVKVADEIIVTEFNRATDMVVSASAKAESIKYKVLSIKYGGKIILKKDSGKALKTGLKTIQQYSNPAILVVTGSLYLVGEIRSML